MTRFTELKRHSFLSKLLPCLLGCLISLNAFSQETAIPAERLLFEAIPIPEEGLPTPSYSLTSEDGGNSGENPAADTDTDQSLLERIREIEQYLASSEEYEAEEGPYSEELRENLVTLGLSYQTIDEHETALTHLKRAAQITRVNNGLNSIDQIPIMENMMPSFLALGNVKEADEFQDSMLEIAKNNYGEASAELIPSLEKIGEWNMQAFLERSNILVNISRINVQNFLTQTGYSPTDSSAAQNTYLPPADDPRGTPLFKLYQAQNNFLSAVSILVNSQNYTHPRLLELERKLVSTYFLRTHRENILYEPDFYLTRKKRTTGSRLDTSTIEKLQSEDYELGQASLKRSIAYLANAENTDHPMLARAMLEDADWDLLYGRKVRAFEKYEEIYDYYSTYPQAGELVSEIIYPAVPKVLPAYLPPPNSRAKLGITEDEDVQYIGHYDVSFSLDKYGKAKKVKILDNGGAVTRNMELRLNQYLKNIQFRPKFREGENDREVFKLRYMIGI